MKKAIISGFLTLGIVAASLACPVENVISRNATNQNVISQLVQNQLKLRTAKTTIKNLLCREKRSTNNKVKSDAKNSNKVAIWTSPYFTLDKPGAKNKC
jgi:hypothetical protein